MDIDKLIQDITSESEKRRVCAIEKLEEAPPEVILPKLGEIMLEMGTPEVVAMCFDLLERFDASANMIEVRMDGWFEQISKHIVHLEEIVSLMGERFLAYAFILNVQIRSLMVDPISPANTTVHFSLNDEQMQTLSLEEFKLRVVQALLHDERLPIQPTLPFRTETAVAALGGRHLLLAPLFGISIERVVLVSLPPALPRYLVAFVSADGFNIADIEGFLELLRDHLRRDLLGTAEEPLNIDLDAVERARNAAEAGDSMKVVEILQAWPGLLSVLQRTSVKKSLDDDQLALIGEGVGLLGEALEKTNQSQWSEDLYKLGLQFIREGEVGGRLFADLGRLLVRKGSFGEAIGHLKRALSLGSSPKSILPSLGRAFLHRGKVTAAMALLKFSHANGYSIEGMDDDLNEIQEQLDKAGISWDVPIPEASEALP